MNNILLNQLLEELDWQMPANITIKEGGDGIHLMSDGKGLTLTYKTPVDLARGLVLAKQYGSNRSYTYEEKCAFDTFGIMIDCSRNAILTVDGLKRVLRLLALMGYNMVQLYTEDTYEVDGEPYFGYLRGRYSRAELREIDAYAAELGIEMIPCIQTLAHLAAIFHWNAYAPVHDCNDIMLCEEEKTYDLIDRMFASLADSFRSRRIHIGMDEAHMVGLGKYLDRNGFYDRFDIIAKHLSRVCELAAKYGFHPMMWSDMFFRLSNHGDYYLDGRKCEIPERVFANLPEDIALVYWDYYHDNRKDYDEMNNAHKLFGRDVWFAGGAWCWCGFAPDNTNSLGATAEATKSCIRNDIRNFFTTAWGDNGGECSLLSVLPTLAYTASIAYGHYGMKGAKRFFRTLTGVRFDDYMAIESLNKLYLHNERGSAPAKYFLYNDVLLGQYDDMIEKNRAVVTEKLAAAIPLLNRVAKNKRFGYLFRTQKALGLLLQIKFDFGIRLRAAYQKNDRVGLETCLDECDKMLRLLDRFIVTFREQWVCERKPHGFDVQDIRLGALAQRIKSCREILRQYLAGKLNKIAELEEEILPEVCPYTGVWNKIASVNPI
ncbi:MAG: beta-N-acetylhexosaminidase [Clostridia bacterium]|nr:beta-N-acetylhexosaminidase [Clostridia bacterium]